MSETDKRPAQCRNRLQLEGQPYPRSGCVVCKDGGMRGCPYADLGPTPPGPDDDTDLPVSPTLELTEFSGLFLALGVILSEPIGDANRLHFAGRCFDAADAITPGVATKIRAALGQPIHT